MIFKSKKTRGKETRYRSPQISVAYVESQDVLCGSPETNGWDPGSDSEDDMWN